MQELEAQPEQAASFPLLPQKPIGAPKEQPKVEKRLAQASQSGSAADVARKEAEANREHSKVTSIHAPALVESEQGINGNGIQHIVYA